MTIELVALSTAMVTGWSSSSPAAAAAGGWASGWGCEADAGATPTAVAAMKAIHAGAS